MTSINPKPAHKIHPDIFNLFSLLPALPPTVPTAPIHLSAVVAAMSSNVQMEIKMTATAADAQQWVAPIINTHKHMI